MNKEILKKCLDELNKDKSDISYVKGLLEALYSINEPVIGKEVYAVPMPSQPFPMPPVGPWMSNPAPMPTTLTNKELSDAEKAVLSAGIQPK